MTAELLKDRASGRSLVGRGMRDVPMNLGSRVGVGKCPEGTRHNVALALWGRRS